MQYKQVEKDYFIYIEKNERIMDTMTKFCIDKGISNAKVSGIGAVYLTEIGAYDTIAKEYLKKQYNDDDLYYYNGLRDIIKYLYNGGSVKKLNNFVLGNNYSLYRLKDEN